MLDMLPTKKEKNIHKLYIYTYIYYNALSTKISNAHCTIGLIPHVSICFISFF
ncbi:unnamed protein product [Brugia timori]|uniref:Uncharacterized protein n=1 Tax=Brugia timori TaxID=42155 RepID=A0A0R3QGU7_9BILA|nr:unnamed protein product [Brugia timori]